MSDLWEDVTQKCLQRARTLLNMEAAPTAATVEAVNNLVNVAIAIESLNLQRDMQTQCGAAVFRDRPSSRREAKN